MKISGTPQLLENLVAIVHEKVVRYNSDSVYIGCHLKWCIQKLTPAIMHTKVVDRNSVKINQQF